METNLLDRMLNSYLASQTPVTVTLQNKIRVAGRIRAFDSYIIVIDGQRREIVYRHAVSSVAASAEEPKRQPQPAKPTPARVNGRPPRTEQRTKAAHGPTALSASAGDTSINNSMKEGLLRWMQEQKAAK